jgi:hypothetical protein
MMDVTMIMAMDDGLLLNLSSYSLGTIGRIFRFRCRLIGLSR